MASRAEHLPALPLEPLPEIPSGLRIAYAQHLLNKHLRKLRAKLNEDVNYSEPLPQKRLSHSAPSDDPLSEIPEYKGRVAIVGAGATGLYLAMMLKYLKINNVDIYEASDRIGGRCYTYNFPEDKDSPHNYYDIGAMRIPEIPAMQSTLNLVKELKLPKEPYVLNAGCEPEMHYYSNNPSDAPR
ncbi:l-amino acid oxidase, partial [Fusarium langsethiae]